MNWIRPAAAPTCGSVPADFTDRSIISLLNAICTGDPERIAIVCADGETSYGQLHAKVLGLAERLMDRMDAGPVAILLPHGADVLVAMLACLAAGRVCVAVNPTHPAERNALILADSRAGTYIVRSAGDRAALPADAADVVAMDDHAPPVAPVGRDLRSHGPDEAAFIVYTSGSTGRPKGIVLSQRAALARARAVIVAVGMTADDRFFFPGHPSAASAWCFALASLLTGGGVLALDITELGANAAFDLFRQHRLTMLAAFPTMVRLLCRLDGSRAAFASLRMLRTGGERLLASDLAALRDVLPAACRIMPCYASTEGMNVAQWFVPPGFVPAGHLVPSGHLMADHEYAIDDGELVLRSRNIAMGEWRDGRCVPGPLLPDPDDPSLRILRTGDLVRLDDDGLLHVLGRADRQVKIHGFRVEPQEIESALRSVGGVVDAAVLPVADGPVTRLVAFVACGNAGDHAALRKQLGACLAGGFVHAMRPVRLHIVRAFPVLPGGKVDHAALLALDAKAAGFPPE